MDIPEEKYRKIINQYKPYLQNTISQYPIPEGLNLEHQRNLKFIIEKQQYSNGFTVDTYSAIIEEVKTLLNDKNLENNLFAARIMRCLPFYFRLKAIEEVGNELSLYIQKIGTLVNQSSSQPKPNDTKTHGKIQQFHYESMADISQLLLSVYQLSVFSDEIYFDANQKVISIFSRIVQNCNSHDRNLTRNCYEVLRAIFIVFGECRVWKESERIVEDLANQNRYLSDEEGLLSIVNSQNIGNKLINKMISIFSSQQNYYLPSNSNGFSNNTATSAFSLLRLIILKTRQYEVRVRCRMLTGVSYLVSYIPEILPEIYELLTHEVFLILENANEFDTNLQCFLSIKALLSLPLNCNLRTRILKSWMQILSELNNGHSYKKQYYQFYARILKQVSQYKHCPIKIKYYASINYLQITNFISQQFSRFIIYKLACRNIMKITHQSQNKRNNQSNHKIPKQNHNPNNANNIIMNLFQYTWFIDRINQENDLFRSEFLICLLHTYFVFAQNRQKGKSNHGQLKDLLALCHRLLDWQCSCKQETHIPTIKFAFDLYLEFLKAAAEQLGSQIQDFLIELIQRCNQPKMYLLFKFKLISTFIRLPTYYNHIIMYSQTKLDLRFLEGQIHPFMMPRNSKPIFQYQYSLTIDGEIQSRKQIETVKVIMSLLTAIQDIHKQKEEVVTKMIIDYHDYLNKLEMDPTSNKDLINCLQSLEADNYFNESQRNFLLSLIDEHDIRGNNSELTLEQRIVYSPLEIYNSDEEYNIFGNMSPVHLKIRILGSFSYDSVYIEIKKNQWASVSDLNLVISSAVETKQIPFESSIIQIKVDRIGLLNFEAWTVDEPKLMLGSGSHQIKVKHLWMKLDHLRIIDGIRSKAFLSSSQLTDKSASDIVSSSQYNQMTQLNSMVETNKTSKFISKRKDACYLTFCFGEPLLLQILYSRNQIIVTVRNKQIETEVQGMIPEMVDELTDGTAQIL